MNALATAGGLVHKMLGQMLYRLARLLPVDPHLVVLSAYWGRGVQCNPAAIGEAIAREAPHMRCVWVFSANHEADRSEGHNFVRTGTLRFWITLARAHFLINNVNFPGTFRKRRGQVFVQTQHGTPLKAMGLATLGYPVGSTLNASALASRCANWDYVLSSNEFSSEVWRASFPGTYTILETGYPRNDILVHASAEDVLRARASLGLRCDQKAYLYMPTLRDSPQSTRPHLDVDAILEALGPNTVILIRGHYLDNGRQATALSGRVIDVGPCERVEDLYLAADVLITDYSSAMFDYALLDRPMFIYAPDWDEYRAFRGTTFDLFACPPGPIATSSEGLIRNLLVDETSREFVSTRQRFRARFCTLDDGQAAKRVTRSLILGIQGQVARVPLSDRPVPPTPTGACESVDTDVKYPSKGIPR